MAADAADATLEVTIFSIDNLKKPIPTQFLVAWIDPRFKRSTKTLTVTTTTTNNDSLHFPLPPSILQNPSSVLTIQILASRFPFHRSKLVGAAALPLSSVRLGGGEVHTLQLRKTSGRGCGSVRVSARILWCLGIVHPRAGESEWFDFDADPRESGRSDFSYISSCSPTAPPMFERGDCDSQDDSLRMPSAGFLSVDSRENERSDFSYIVGPTAPPMAPACESCDFDSKDDVLKPFDFTATDASIVESEGCAKSEGSGGSKFFEEIGPQIPEYKKENGKEAWRNFLLGMVSGAFAAVLVGVAGFLED